MITYDEFLLIYPVFASIPQARIEAIIEMASRQISPEHSLVKDLTGLLTAHYLSANDSNRRGGAGGIKSIDIRGETRIDYDVGGAAASRDSLDQTSYGREYRRLLEDVTAMFV